MRLLASIFALGLGSCAAPLHRPLPDPAPQSIRILTWNVNWGVAHPDRVAAFLRLARADIVCLQETNAEWEAELAARVGDLYPHREFRESEGRMGGGLAFLSKQRGQETAYMRSTTGWFDGWIMRFPHAGGMVPVLNVHLRPPVSESGSAVTGYITTNDDREREIVRFASQLDPRQANIVCGDFNESTHGYAVKWLEKFGMLNALPQFDRRSPTWEWPTPVMTLRRRMDHVMVQACSWTCVHAQVVRVPASDHFPVVTDLVHR
jgi:endonuclease/exonuclease/phosphatase (EEP) superfamily protein YafD